MPKTDRPFIPCGSYETKQKARIAAQLLNDEDETKEWQPTDRQKNDKFAIQRIR
jgi:hypothetical protein